MKWKKMISGGNNSWTFSGCFVVQDLRGWPKRPMITSSYNMISNKPLCFIKLLQFLLVLMLEVILENITSNLVQMRP